MSIANTEGTGRGVPSINTNVSNPTSGLGVQDAINRVFANIETNIANPYNAGYAAGQNAINTDEIVSKIMNSLNLSDPSSYLSAAKDLADLNTASSQAMAREQMKFQEQANAKAMDFSASEALKTRDWQTMMSNTAHQREVADLIAAGLNPVLSVNQGAAVGSAANAQGVTSSGAKGSVDTSVVNALVSMYSKAADMAMQQKSLEVEQNKIDANVLMNALTNDTNRYAASRSAQATMYSADANSSAHRYAAELDYNTWASGLHNQYAQLGEWIYKALSGLNFSDMFNLDLNNIFGNGKQDPITYDEPGKGVSGGAAGGGSGGAWGDAKDYYWRERYTR